MYEEALTGLPVMRYQSENFTLDTDDYSLTRNGINHAIEPQVFNLLVYLIDNRNRVVTREELLDQLWHGRIVTDSAINARLKAARRAVGDSGKQQRVIKTIHGRGYQFIADVIVSTSDEREIETGVSKSASSSEKPPIAVLRFSNLSNDPNQAYFADGMTTNICSRLSRIRSLQVKSGIEYDLTKTSLADVTRELDVRYVLSGSVQRESDHVRVFVELTEGASGDIKWSEHFDRRGNDVILIQDEIAQEITGTLWSNRGTIREAERDKLAKKPTSDFNAFDYILKGISYKEQYRAETLGPAITCFDKAIELDPDSAEAWGWKAWVFLLERWLGGDTDYEESLNQAFISAKKSIAIDAYSEIGHWSLAAAYLEQGDKGRGFSELDKALDINPNNPDLMVHKGTELCFIGKFDEGIELLHRGINFNKHYPQWYYWHLGLALFAGHQWQESVEAFLRMDEQNRDTLIFLSSAYVQGERMSEARTCFRELLQVDPEIDTEKIENTHTYLAADTLKILVDGIRLLMANEQPQERLRVVKR